MEKSLSSFLGVAPQPPVERMDMNQLYPASGGNVPVRTATTRCLKQVSRTLPPSHQKEISAVQSDSSSPDPDSGSFESACGGSLLIVAKARAR